MGKNINQEAKRKMQLTESTKNKLRVVEPIILVIAIITMGYFIYVVSYGNGAECLANPLVYGTQELSNGQNGYFSCGCVGSNNLNQLITVTPEGMLVQDREDVILKYG